MNLSVQSQQHLGAHSAATKHQTAALKSFGRYPCEPFCVQSLRSSSSSRQHICSSSVGSSTHAPTQLKRQSRRAVKTQAWFAPQPTRQLWNYQGSCVRQLSLQELQLLHRLSFGHRNQRSYLITLYQSDSAACQAFEQEIERLASGLQHESAFVAAALDVADSKAANFAAHMLGVEQVPAVLLYPEAARGFLKFLGPDMSAPGMLKAINTARQKAWPGTATAPGAAEWQLREATVPLAVTAVRAAALTGDREAVVTALHQQLPSLQPTPLAVTQQLSYWNQGRLMFWGGLLLCSTLLLAWDLKLADAWEDWCLTRRQAARARGRKFTVQENLDDMVTLLMKGVQQKMLGAVDADAPEVIGDEQQQQHQREDSSTRAAGPFDRRRQEQQPAQPPAQQHGPGAPAAVSQQPEQSSQLPQQQQFAGQDLTMKQQGGGGWVLDQSR